jgi:hypothetical protein
MGLAGEAGEVVNLLKKVRFQGHALESAKFKDELGTYSGTWRSYAIHWA